MATLKEISDGLAAAVEKAGAGVVRVEGRRGPAASGTVWEIGLVLTADHVLEGDEGIRVSDGGGSLAAVVVGRDPRSDLALLRVDGLGAAPAPRSAGALRPGELVLAIGRPRALESTFGVVNAVAPASRGWRGWFMGDMIQTEAPLNRGFSGGPLVDADGAVVGFNSWYYGRGNTRALPVATADRIARDLREVGHVRRPYLGIGTQPVSLDPPLRAAAGQDSGLLVVSVDGDSAAGVAGVLQGDTLLAVGDHATERMHDLIRALVALEVGSVQPLKLLRGGQVTTVPVTLGEWPREEAADGE
ncbi:MAG TPA: S1C family serine protease [Candidatus Dormibacteraeota bacterium]|jgi:S1-C subfamily serine protease|nr:S1C family serine protease [Candidatus Dormibacteraeota bacterium]